MNFFAMLMLIVGAAMFAVPLGIMAYDGWTWYYFPIIVVGLVILIGGLAEGTS